MAFAFSTVTTRAMALVEWPANESAAWTGKHASPAAAAIASRRAAGTN